MELWILHLIGGYFKSDTTVIVLDGIIFGVGNGMICSYFKVSGDNLIPYVSDSSIGIASGKTFTKVTE